MRLNLTKIIEICAYSIWWLFVWWNCIILPFKKTGFSFYSNSQASIGLSFIFQIICQFSYLYTTCLWQLNESTDRKKKKKPVSIEPFRFLRCFFCFPFFLSFFFSPSRTCTIEIWYKNNENESSKLSAE